MKNDLKWRWLFFFIGLAVLCLGVSMTIKGKVLGVSPWEVLHIALVGKVGLTVGSWSVITGLLVVAASSLYLKEWPKFATWLNMFLCGIFIDFFNWLLPDPSAFIYEALYFLIGVMLLGVGCALYISPNLGAGPRDTIMIILAKKLGGSIGKARLMMEAVIAFIGWFLGGPVGLGTIIIALCTGYIVQFFLPFFRKMLEKRIRHSNGQNEIAPNKNLDHLAKES